jgi:hypothetical protein
MQFLQRRAFNENKNIAVERRKTAESVERHPRRISMELRQTKLCTCSYVSASATSSFCLRAFPSFFGNRWLHALLSGRLSLSCLRVGDFCFRTEELAGAKSRACCSASTCLDLRPSVRLPGPDHLVELRRFLEHLWDALVGCFQGFLGRFCCLESLGLLKDFLLGLLLLPLPCHGTCPKPLTNPTRYLTATLFS